MSVPRVGWRALAALILTVAGGCGGDAAPPAPGPTTKAGGSSTPAPGKPRLMFITNSSSDWWNAVETGMNDAARETGAAVEMRRIDGEASQQIMRLEDVLGLSDVQGVAISVLEQDTPGIADKMRELQKAGKIVIAVDSDGQKDARSAYVGTLNRDAGALAGRVARSLRPQGGKTVVFVGTKSAANAIARREGFFEAAGKEFVQTEVFEDGTDHSRAQLNVQSAITKLPDVGVFLGLWSYNAHFIAEEVSKFPDLRKRATVVTFDLDELAVQDMDRGAIDATICQNPYQIGYMGVKLLNALVTKNQAEIDKLLPGGTDMINTGLRVVVPQKNPTIKEKDVMDIQEMKAWLATKGLKST